LQCGGNFDRRGLWLTVPYSGFFSLIEKLEMIETDK
jgi:hypothetical protein